MLRHAAVALVLAFAAMPALAQDADAEKVKQAILDKVRARIQEEHKKILEKLAAVIDAELGRAAGAKAEPGGAGDSAKKLRDLQKKATQLEDERDTVLKEIRGLKREEEDAALRRDAEKIPLDQETLSDMFNEHLNAHSAAVPMLKTDRAKAVAEFRKTIDGFKKLWYKLKDNRALVGLALPSAYNVACGYALIGEKEQALDWIEIAIANGYNDFEHMRADSDFDSLRKERRYQKLLLDR